MTQGMPNPRPALRGMGVWKWPAFLLVLFCLVIIYPYAERAGGGHSLASSHEHAELQGCSLDYQARTDDGRITIRARIRPDCARSLQRPSVVLLNNDGAALAKTPLTGNPNSLFARLSAPGQEPGEPLKLALRAASPEGAHEPAILYHRLQSEPLRARKD